MKPKKTPQKNQQRDLFRASLSNMINPNHGLVKLARVVEWDRLDEIFGSTYCAENGRPGVSTRLIRESLRKRGEDAAFCLHANSRIVTNVYKESWRDLG